MLSQLIILHSKQLAAAISECFRSVIESSGVIQYKVYIWSDGEIETLQDLQGGNTYLRARDFETRELHYVCLVESPCWNAWDYSESPVMTTDDDEIYQSLYYEWLDATDKTHEQDLMRQMAAREQYIDEHNAAQEKQIAQWYIDEYTQYTVNTLLGSALEDALHAESL